MMKLFAMLVLLFSCPAAANVPPAPISYMKIVMGTQAEVKVFGLDESGSEAAADAVFAELERLEKSYSVFESSSEVSLINTMAWKQWVRLTDECYALLARGLELSRRTEGHFDITFMPLWDLWRAAEKRKKLPTGDEIKQALSSVGYGAIRLDAETKSVKFDKPLKINMGGLVKDYALARCAEIIPRLAARPSGVLVNLGGDLLAVGGKGGGVPWKIGVQHPTRKSELLGIIELPGGAVLASGTYERYLEIGGKRFCHLIDAKTGYPIENFSSLTVYLPDITREHMPTIALVLGGRAKAADAMKKMPGSSMLWVDGKLSPGVVSGPGFKGKWDMLSEK